MRILIITDVILAGGAEMFVLRLAEGLATHGHQASLFIVHGDKIDYNYHKTLAPDAPLFTVHIPGLKWWSKMDGLLYRMGLPYSFLEKKRKRELDRVVKKFRPDIIHSHLFTSDILAVAAGNEAGVPVVTTNHGDFLAYERTPGILKASRILNYRKLLKSVLMSMDTMVYISEEQKLLMDRLKNELVLDLPLKKIYNGYVLPKEDTVISRSELGIPEDAFVVGMVARGIKVKGWYELIEGFLQAAIPNAHLILVGGGPYIDEIRPQYTQPNIHFTGNVIRPIPYVRLFDLACMTSHHKGESLPTTIIEYLFCGKAVLGTTRGEIPAMLRVGTSGAAGVVIGVDNTEQMVTDVRDQIKKLYEDKALLQQLAEHTKTAATAFDMDQCINSYLQVFEQAINSGHK